MNETAVAYGIVGVLLVLWACTVLLDSEIQLSARLGVVSILLGTLALAFAVNYGLDLAVRAVLRSVIG